MHDESEEDLNLQQQKEEAMALNKTWGNKTASFYGRNKDNDDESDTSDD